MNYATVADLLQRHGEDELRNITDPTGQAVDEGRAGRALSDASAEVDTYLGQRYVLPLRDDSAVLRRCTCDIAVYRLQTLRPADDIKDARQRYEDVLKLLVRVAKGEVDLAGATLLSEAQHTAGLVQFGHPPSLFGRAAR